MPKSDKISISVIKRMPRYYRFLGKLKEEGCLRVSSRELSEKMGATASQIRQDLNCFGGFGQQGYGYNVEQLYTEIGKILGVDKRLGAILIGAGNLGRAIASHMNFESRGFKLIGIFDKDDTIKGEKIKGIEIMPMDMLESFCRQHKPQVSVVCIPSDTASALIGRLIDNGITGFWNFSHFDILSVYPHVQVENVHLADSLMTLSYQMKK